MFLAMEIELYKMLWANSILKYPYKITKNIIQKQKTIMYYPILFSIFFTFSQSITPVVIIPPMLGSQLYANVTDFSSHWYCPKNFENKLLWLSEEMVIPPILNCLAEYLASEWDPSTNTIKNKTNTQIFSPDFGGVSSFEYADSGIFGYKLIPVFGPLINKLQSLGYEVKKNLFGVPYDWRNAPYNIDYIYPMMKDLIEQAYILNDNQKVCLLGYSLGCWVTHHFLTKIVDQKWKDKYVQKVIWAAASFGGSMDALRVAYFHRLDYIPELFVTESIEKLLESTLCAYAQFPNYNVFPHRSLVYGPNGEEYGIQDIADLLKQLGKIDDEFLPIFEKGIEQSQTQIEDPGVNSYFAFNTGLNTVKSLNFSNGWDKDPSIDYIGGDATMEAAVLYYGCNNWVNSNLGKTILCHDFNQTSSDYSHISILSTDEFVKVMVEIIQKDNWLLPGTHNITGMEAPNFFENN